MDSIYARRREELCRRLGPRAVAFLHGAPLRRRNSDVEYRYRAPSDLLYLTGHEEPDACAVIAPGRKERFTLFVRPRDREREVWTGRRLGTEGAVALRGADQAFAVDELEKKLVELVDGAEELHYLPGDDERADQLVARTLATLRMGERRGRRTPLRIVDLRHTLHEQRLVKDEPALADLRRAVEITTEAHTAAMRATRPGMHEYEIEALIDYTFRRRGGWGPGYGTIVGGGANATILHYVDNDAPLRAGDLLLVDAGGEFHGTTADVTRTWPVSGRFSEAQRQVYEVVLDAQKQVIAAVRPGANIDSLHWKTVELLTAGMVKLGLLRGDVAELIKSNAYQRYYMHRTSHWLGLDVHDVGVYAPAPGYQSRPMAAGMVLTVEPGLYIAEDDKEAPAALRGIGVRIEDDILVTETGHEILTHAIPKEPADIERLMAEAAKT